MASSFLNHGTAYPGGKGKSYQHIINVMPPHQRYVESYLGAGSVMRFKRPARRSIGIDLDGRVVDRWETLGNADLAVIHGDALLVLPELGLCAQDLLYCDPPFHPETRRRPGTYRHDLTAKDHERLLDLLLRLPCKVVLSGYDNELYRRVLPHWSRRDFRTRTHAGMVTESIWTNYEPGPVLHDYSFVGSCFRERERLRRRIDALSSRLENASDVERNAALATLADRRPDTVRHAAERAR